MLKIDRSTGKLSRLKNETLSRSGITERGDLQELIFQNGDEFFKAECGEDLFILAQEVCPSKHVADRIDLLALDADGKLVVIELKRGNHKLQLLQALSYAAMISAEMSSREAVESLVSLDRRDAFDAFVNNGDFELEAFNTSQRIILIAESYDYEVLQTAQWLTESHGLNITCYQIALAFDGSSRSEYLSAIQLYPAKRLAEQARQRGVIRSQAENRFPTLEERLAESTNPAVKHFFELWLESNPRRNRRADSIVIPNSGKTRFRLTSRRGYARIAQLGRFAGDQEKWDLLSPGTVKIRPDGLRFRLSTLDSLTNFKRFVDAESSQLLWNKASDTNSTSEEQDDED